MGFATLQSPTFMADFLRQSGGYAVIDGGLATELERHGADLNDPLWSATCLIHSPDLIRRVHLDYLEAGASIIITASYQATIQGFEAKGLSREEAEALLRRSVEIACEARDIYHERCAKGTCLEQRPILVAASVGSYGAYLADGSEYSGHYGAAVTLETLKDFHRRRVQVLAESGADLIAFETIPNKLEAKAYAELLDEVNIKIPAWFSFTSLDGINVVSGDSLIECASIADSCKQVVAVGINCTPPRFIHGLILLIQKVCYARFMFFLQGLIFKIDMVTLFSFPNSCEKLKDSFSTLILISMYLSILLLYEEDSFHYGECNSDRRKRDETQVTTKPVVIYPNSGETYDGGRKEWVKSSGVQDGDFVSYVSKWREAGASLFGGCCRTSPHTIRAISMTLSSYLQ